MADDKEKPIPTVCADGITRLCYPNVKAVRVVVNEETNKMLKLDFNNNHVGAPRPKSKGNAADIDENGIEDAVAEDEFASALMKGKL